MIFLPVTQAYSEKEIRITSTSAIRLQLNLCKQDNCRPISRWMSTDVQKKFRIYCSILLEGFLLNMRTSYQAAFEWFINRTGPVYTWESKQCEKRYFSRLNTEFSKENFPRESSAPSQALSIVKMGQHYSLYMHRNVKPSLNRRVVFQMVETGNGDFLEYNIYLTRGWGPNMVSFLDQFMCKTKLP